PHLLAPVHREGGEIAEGLRRLVEEMVWREETGVRMPRVLLAVDEVADLLTAEPALAEPLTRLAARGRSAGLHLLLCTQKPTAEALGSVLRANLPCRLVGRVVSAQEAVLASGIRGTRAEQLLGRGDFVLVAGGEVIRFQAAYIGTEEIRAMVQMLREEHLAWTSRPARPVSPLGGRGRSPVQWVARLLEAVRSPRADTGEKDRVTVSRRSG
ncbi:MAG: FtsK/SpoIIIE domain-containing protein, partial [Chloroflexia bacterium]